MTCVTILQMGMGADEEISDHRSVLEFCEENPVQ